MQSAYYKLHELGYAHCIEVYLQNKLVGGIYGVCIGRSFFGESMFSHKTDASKVALYFLVKKLISLGFEWMDCQIWSSHLASLGATEIPRADFIEKLTFNNKFESKTAKWTLED
jgi:leucyl/phenylalanyl-tRNA--protein transferase